MHKLEIEFSNFSIIYIFNLLFIGGVPQFSKVWWPHAPISVRERNVQTPSYPPSYSLEVLGFLWEGKYRWVVGMKIISTEAC